MRAGVTSGGASTKGEGIETDAPVRGRGRLAVQADCLLLQGGSFLRRESCYDRFRQIAYP